jgi:hypothetical protein
MGKHGKLRRVCQADSLKEAFLTALAAAFLRGR